MNNGFKKIDVRVGKFVWEGKTSMWKKCERCGNHWTPISLHNGVCPECLGYIKKEIYSPALKLLTDIVFATKGITKDELCEILSHEEGLLRCKKCGRLELSIIEETGLCGMCDKSQELLKQQKVRKKSLRDEIEEDDYDY